MVFSDAIEVAIGLTFVFLLVSLAMAAAVEFIETFAKVRGRKLYDGITELLGDPARLNSGHRAAEALYSHPMLQGIFRGDVKSAISSKQLPSYIPASSFALALIDQTLAIRLNPNTTTSATIPATGSLADRLRLAAERIENDQLRRAISQAVDVGGSDFDKIKSHLEAWYDSAMDRISGSFKRRSQRIQFWLGLAAAVFLNVNTLTIADSLSKNAAMRRAVVSQVEAGLPTSEDMRTDPSQVIARVDRLGLPMGWSKGAVDALLLPVSTSVLRTDPVPTGSDDRLRRGLGWFQIALGYIFTALAITLGAPFWFDFLNRLMVIRATVKPREKSQEEGSEDRPHTENRTITIVEAKATTAAMRSKPPSRDDHIYADPPDFADKIFEDEIRGPAGTPA